MSFDIDIDNSNDGKPIPNSREEELKTSLTIEEKECGVDSFIDRGMFYYKTLQKVFKDILCGQK